MYGLDYKLLLILILALEEIILNQSLRVLDMVLVLATSIPA